MSMYTKNFTNTNNNINYTSEDNCLYISSRGILKTCDITYTSYNSSRYDLPDFDKMYNGCSVYICNAAINNFASYIDKIEYNFILVSGDADEENYKQMFSNYDNFINFISNYKIIHWFCQNSNVLHNKITNLPIGLDYHVLSTNINHQFGPYNTPIEQENIIINIKNNSIPFHKRNIKCYINFSYPPDMYTYKFDRIEALAEIDKNLYYKEPLFVKRYESFKNQTEYAFVISPYGNGLDCHRTWEALILGCIPIIRTSNMDILFDGLPVLIINKWNDITLDLLKNTINTFMNIQFNYNKLLLKYWINKINSYKKEYI